MAVAAPVMMYISAGLAAVSAVRQGQAAQAAATFNIVQAEQDKSIARGEALARSLQVQRETVLRLGAIRAASGASGGTGEGSVLDVVADAASQGELERQWVIYQGELKGRGYSNAQTLEGMRGKSAADASITQAGTALLGGGMEGALAQSRLRRG
jgi:hypothetical protein